MTIVRRLFSLPRLTKSHREGDTMLAYHLSTIDVRVRRIEHGAGNNSMAAALLKEIRDQLADLLSTGLSQGLGNDLAWNEASRLERLLALID